MPKIDIAKIAVKPVSGYPAPFKKVRRQAREASSSAMPSGSRNSASTSRDSSAGGASSLRHWHGEEDEFIYILEGELVLIEDDGETVLKPGDAAGWKANSPNGHTLGQPRQQATRSSSKSARVRNPNACTIRTSI